ncbi:hypothetical protein J8273_2138 [Carpediemonas membranifera]|uniref:Uncharacterized protein n=1 Tax=Carpediemonas membranifera TaxID=201153 RepID=A0A8J6BAV4_9EUKA|nr:hypothetical protein J8273_2138 [Carpediemonas membranifera]|eukprot:KAG9396407.1 hypothetical protein J8273_2138 [Carpediemonas membranifera]
MTTTPENVHELLQNVTRLSREGKHVQAKVLAVEAVKILGESKNSSLGLEMAVARHNLAVEYEFLKAYHQAISEYDKMAAILERHKNIDESVAAQLLSAREEAKRVHMAKITYTGAARRVRSPEVGLKPSTYGVKRVVGFHGNQRRKVKLPSSLPKQQKEVKPPSTTGDAAKRTLTPLQDFFDSNPTLAKFNLTKPSPLPTGREFTFPMASGSSYTPQESFDVTMPLSVSLPKIKMSPTKAAGTKPSTDRKSRLTKSVLPPIGLPNQPTPPGATVLKTPLTDDTDRFTWTTTITDIDGGNGSSPDRLNRLPEIGEVSAMDSTEVSYSDVSDSDSGE